MTPHVHDQDISTWSAARLRQHIRAKHGHTPPISWGAGELHQSHLALHLDDQTPEEKPMSHCGHQCPDAPIACTYETGHGKLTDPGDQFGEVVHGTFDHGNVRADAWWVEVPETESHEHADLGHFHHITSRYDVANHLMNAHGVAHEDIAMTEVLTQHASLHPALDPHVNRPTLTDRLEEALSGQRLLQEANVRQVAAMTELEERLREVIAEREEARQQLDTAVVTRDRAMEAGYILERERDEALAEIERLERLGEERQVQHAEAVQRELHTQEDFRRVCREKQDAQDALHRLQGQWDRVVPRLEDRLIKRTQALADGRTALLAWIKEIKLLSSGTPGPEYTDWNGQQIIDRITAIIGETAPSAMAVQASADLGLATTGELIEEIRTRIDLGHCGLGYRPVDTEGDA